MWARYVAFSLATLSYEAINTFCVIAGPCSTPVIHHHCIHFASSVFAGVSVAADATAVDALVALPPLCIPHSKDLILKHYSQNPIFVPICYVAGRRTQRSSGPALSLTRKRWKAQMQTFIAIKFQFLLFCAQKPSLPINVNLRNSNFCFLLFRAVNRKVATIQPLNAVLVLVVVGRIYLVLFSIPSWRMHVLCSAIFLKFSFY